MGCDRLAFIGSDIVSTSARATVSVEVLANGIAQICAVVDAGRARPEVEVSSAPIDK